MNNHKNYLDILRRCSDSASFYQASIFMQEEESDALKKDYEKHIIYKSVFSVVGPVMLSYVLWVLREALKSGMKTLFFLARDGKIMKELAELLIEKYHLDFQCHYLYVSRYSLRKALFIVAPEEIWEYLRRYSLKVTPELVLERSGLTKEVQQELLRDLGFQYPEQSTKLLTPKELIKFTNMLQMSERFQNEMTQNALEQNQLIFQYFKEQGLTTDQKALLVDSGWTGSMQRCIRQLLSFNGCTTMLEGYYFGIQSKTKKEDGFYHSFYFDYRDARRYVLFNNNLFECWCMADHGMTVGYQKGLHGIVPVLKEASQNWHQEFQSDLLKMYTTYFMRFQENFFSVPFESLPQLAEPLLVQFMMYPNKDEAFVYGRIPFCDDTTEAYMQPLAARLSRYDLFCNLTVVKSINKALKFIRQLTIKESGWREGTISLLPQPLALIMQMDSQISYAVKIIAAHIR